MVSYLLLLLPVSVATAAGATQVIELLQGKKAVMESSHRHVPTSHHVTSTPSHLVP